MKVWTFSLLFFPVESIRQCFHIIRAAFPWGMPEPGTSGAPGAAPHPHLTRPSPGEPSPAAKPHRLFPVPIPLSCQAPSRPFALLKPGLPFSPPTKPQSEEGTKAKPSQALPVESQVGALPASPAELNPFFLGQLQHLAVHGSLREHSQTRLLPPGAPVGMEKPPLGRQRAELHLSTSSPGFASAPHQQNPPPNFGTREKMQELNQQQQKKQHREGQHPKINPTPAPQAPKAAARGWLQ